MVEQGASVDIKPIFSPLKRNWFTRAEGNLPGLVSRHRFLVTLRPRGGRLTLERPLPSEQLTEVFVPLARLGLGARREAPRAKAVLHGPDDVSRLEDLLVGLASGQLTLSGAIPLALHDSCRFEGGPCVSLHDATGAAGAILDLDGNVRPCSQGSVIAHGGDSLATLLQRQRRLWTETGLRRGCDTCVVKASCPRCLFPGPLSERHYCAILRAAAPELPLLQRLMAILAALETPLRTLSVKLRRTASLLAARGRPLGRLGPHWGDEAAAAARRG